MKHGSWYKFKVKSSSGISSWEYTYCPCDDKDSVEYYFEEEVENRHNWSEHYRGIDLVKIKDEDIPPKILSEHIESKKARLKELKEYVKEISAIKSKYKTDTDKPLCKNCGCILRKKNYSKTVIRNLRVHEKFECAVCENTTFNHYPVASEIESV